MKTDKPKASTKFYTIPQIAECIDASTRTVRRWIEKGLLVAHRINGLVRISEADFLAFLLTHRDMRCHTLSYYSVIAFRPSRVLLWFRPGRGNSRFIGIGRFRI